MASEKVNQLQLLQQNLHHFLVQKQKIEGKLTEIDIKNRKKHIEVVHHVALVYLHR